jgi:hypothetical protein
MLQAEVQSAPFMTEMSSGSGSSQKNSSSSVSDSDCCSTEREDQQKDDGASSSLSFLPEELVEPLEKYKSKTLRKEIYRLKLKIIRRGPNSNDHKKGYIQMIRAYRDQTPSKHSVQLQQSPSKQHQNVDDPCSFDSKPRLRRTKHCFFRYVKH